MNVRQHRHLWACLLAVGFWLAAACAWAAPSFPALSGRVVDQAGVLSPEAETRLAALSESVEQKTGAQFVVASVSSLEDYDIAESRIHVCYNGIDLDAFHPEGPPKQPSGIVEGTPVIGSVSVLRPEKDFATLIKACARLRGERPFRLVLIGSGPELEPLKQLASSSGLQDHVHFEPAAEDVAPWLRGIDIFVLPSRSEALSNALMEAMACGCGAVASNIGGNPELVTPDRTGLLFNAGDDAGLAQALQSLLDDPGRLARLRRASADFIRDQFSLTRSADCMGEIYQKLIERKHG